MEVNTLNDINTIKQKDNDTQQSLLSALATKVCNNRYYKDSNKDKFWVTDKIQWQFCSSLISKARKIFIAIGSLNRDLCKYAFGKRILSRTNWKTQSFQIVGDIEGKKKKKLCFEANNLKRAYEMKITEKIIEEQYKAVISLNTNLQHYIIDSEDLISFCRSYILRVKWNTLKIS